MVGTSSHCVLILKNAETINNNWISALLEDSENHLWIGTDHGLNRLDLETGRIERIPMIHNGQAVEKPS